MKHINIAHLVFVSVSMAVHILFLNPYTFGQIDDTTGLVKQDNNTNTSGLSNDGGIMENTSGVIDDTLDVLKDSLGSFFEKR